MTTLNAPCPGLHRARRSRARAERPPSRWTRAALGCNTLSEGSGLRSCSATITTSLSRGKPPILGCPGRHGEDPRCVASRSSRRRSQRTDHDRRHQRLMDDLREDAAESVTGAVADDGFTMRVMDALPVPRRCPGGVSPRSPRCGHRRGRRRCRGHGWWSIAAREAYWLLPPRFAFVRLRRALPARYRHRSPSRAAAACHR